MPRVTVPQTNFTAGEISPSLQGRTDIKYYYNGASKLRNVFVQPQGGVRRRDGIEYIDTIPSDGSGDPSNTRLVSFEFSTIQRYMILFYHNGCKVYKDGVLQATVSMPYSSDDMSRLYFTQSLDTLLITHPEHAPRQLERQGSDTSWASSTWPLNNIPQYAFPDGSYTGVDEVQEIRPTGTFTADKTTYKLSLAGEETSNILWSSSSATNASRIQSALRALTLTSSSGVTVSESSGVYTVTFGGDDGDQYWGEMNWEIVAEQDGTEQFSITVTTEGESGGEDSWSATRGWPVSGIFHQGRLFFAGSRDRPNTIWFSRSGDLTDFTTAETLADFGGEFTADTDDVAAFFAVFAGRHLQFFSQSSEFYVPISDTEGITPENFSLRRTTFRGCVAGLPVFGVDGATIFIQRGGKGLREFIYNDVEQAYQANDISFLASHLVNEPQAIAYRKASNTEDADYILFVNKDGIMTVFCTLRTQEINAYTAQEVRGKFTDVGVSLDDIYCVTEEDINGTTARYLGRFNEELRVDNGVIDTAVTGGPTTITGLDHLEGETVTVYTDGFKRADAVVASGQITVDDAISSSYQVGLAFPDVSGGKGYGVYVETVDPAPDLPEGSVMGKKKRVVEAILRLIDTGQIVVNDERIYLREFGDSLLDQPANDFTGDYTVDGILGWDESGRVWIGDDIGAKMNIVSIAYKLGV